MGTFMCPLNIPQILVHAPVHAYFATGETFVQGSRYFYSFLHPHILVFWQSILGHLLMAIHCALKYLFANMYINQI